MNKIRRVSLFFRVLFQILFVVLPVLVIIAWIIAPSPILSTQSLVLIDMIPREYPIMHPLSITTKILGCLMSMIPTAVELFILYCLIQLFFLYEKGEIFSLQNVRYIRNVAYALLVGQLISPFYEAIMGVILTWNNPHGHRFASITFNGTNVGILLTALFVILISWIMAEGCKLREEQQLTI
jgi:hypothetical protein